MVASDQSQPEREAGQLVKMAVDQVGMLTAKSVVRMLESV